MFKRLDLLPKNNIENYDARVIDRHAQLDDNE